MARLLYRPRQRRTYLGNADVDKADGVELVGKLTPRGHEISKYDNMFDMKLRYFEGSVQFVQKIKFTKPSYSVNCHLEYGACNDQNCMPPTQVEFKKAGKAPATAAADPAAQKQQKDAKDALTAQAAGASAPGAAADSLAKTDSTAVMPDSATVASQPFGPLETRHQAAQRLRRRQRAQGHVVAIHILRRIPRRTPRARHPLRVAHHTDDRQLLPQT
jgi:hypothetical protein